MPTTSACLRAFGGFQTILQLCVVCVHVCRFPTCAGQLWIGVCTAPSSDCHNATTRRIPPLFPLHLPHHPNQATATATPRATFPHPMLCKWERYWKIVQVFLMRQVIVLN